MHNIPVSQLTRHIRELFAKDMPAGIRCTSVLDGITNGRVFVDNPTSPGWAVLQQTGEGTLYLGGELDAPTLANMIETFRQDGDVLIGVWPDSPYNDILPKTPDYTGVCIDFYDRDSGNGLERFLPLPEGCHLEHATVENTRSRAGAQWIIALQGSLERAFETIFGYYLVRGNEIVCESIVGAPVHGIVEMGIETHPNYRRAGYATCLCAHVILQAESRGYQTYWNCNRSNAPSIALARKLGYRTAREYRLAAWPKIGTIFGN